jgi:hypothetical protein
VDDNDLCNTNTSKSRREYGETSLVISLHRDQGEGAYWYVGNNSVGVSTGLALQRQSPYAKIILSEGLCMRTAPKKPTESLCSHFLDQEYVELADRPKAKWETELPYCNFYCKTGWLQEVSDADSTG